MTSSQHIARFTSGSTLKHVVIMTASSSISLLILFLVDLIDLLFISQLGEIALASAIGYAGSILFFTTSMCIGFSIACGALVAKSLGQGKVKRAKSYVSTVSILSFLFAIAVAIILWLSIPSILTLLGASGQAHGYATSYLRIIIPSMPILILALACNATLRSIGKPGQSMITMILGAVVNAIFDPIFIFVFDWGIDGAAYASVLSRITMMVVGGYYLIAVHGFYEKPHRRLLKPLIVAIIAIAFPAILTNITTPLSNAFIINQIAQFGDSAVAGMSVIARIVPFAFVAIFAMSGAIGPIIGQNFGAQNFERIRQTLRSSLLLSFTYSLVITILLIIFQPFIVKFFLLEGEAAELVKYYCLWLSIFFFFSGMQFLVNASFNNLGLAKYSTFLNIAKASIGTIPFVLIGAEIAQTKGVLAGQTIGGVLVAIFSFWFCLRVLARLEQGDSSIEVQHEPYKRRFPRFPFSRLNG